jgi:peroxisomal 2,4-dienoyl-CoA reductase
MGEVQDIAQSTVFLFSEGASYITGVVLVVDGNYQYTSNIFFTLTLL